MLSIDCMDNNQPTIIDTPLPNGIAGLTNGTTIWLNTALTPRGRRCTLAHELAHIERGIIHDLPAYLYQREESRVDAAAARALVTVDELINALLWIGGDTDRATLADLLDIDHDTLNALLAGTTPTETARITRALTELQQVP